MKILIAATTALALTGSALAYQTYTTDAQTTVSATPPAVTVSIDPTVAITPPTVWTPEQVTLWEEHVAFMPPTWTAEQRAAFQAMMSIPPANWTAEQRALYQAHFATLPSTWTAEQRAMYLAQVEAFRTPWLSATQTASTTVPAGTTLAMAPVGDRVHEPSNANPEHDARGIAVISDPAIVPEGYNGFAGTGMGGPLIDPATGETIDAVDNTYPACTATVTDNCIQLYERGVRAALASWDRPTGGLRTTATGMGGPLGEDEVGDNTPEDDAIDVDTDGDLDVDGDLDGDGDNDLE